MCQHIFSLTAFHVFGGVQSKDKESLPYGTGWISNIEYIPDDQQASPSIKDKAKRIEPGSGPKDSQPVCRLGYHLPLLVLMATRMGGGCLSMPGSR